MSSDEYFLSLCIQEAWKYQSLTLPNPSVGAMVVDGKGNILSISAHKKAGLAHAEVNALKIAYEKLTHQKCDLVDSKDIHQYLKTNHKGIFRDCIVYVTLEPCNHYGKTPPCAELIEEIHPKKVVIGSSEIQKQASGGAQRLEQSGIEVIKNILKNECENLLYPFLCLKNQGHFNLFKIAQRLNGDYQSGAISSKESRTFTHNQRCVADTIMISGKTLRVDKPTLDTRYCTKEYDGKLPNVQILTKQEPFYDAPLFKISHRRVDIFNDIRDVKLQEGFNIIEGGWDLFESINPFVDMVLMHISPTIKQGIQSKGFDYNAELLHTQKLGNDGLLWIKKS
ncbi:riboflavin biosynthesis protein RibD [Helicobacter sp. 13S00482-2]|uniref:bifunctional diaminohydroxyphosphoribosylaminopyrimidine deaminase/5-amino-6-(5-phosphoribosylamino)uracil reductase RibD n=1 Tax=Helicobacter sp. 13S00482-2 TaxID=1476200 RepID=UPI000BA7C701|nr:bifunctional diaminohydroxyphosphoribosylaminopyrimidine deaminase/5-amino-6-(5-phosphoribosylamino)uracil reductase RibD [Helicobacter sp. 13S00482-2]PAF54545.1 riboflavin biosynthesis protein RibD [Helicobacter sp. 13S00482-2]